MNGSLHVWPGGILFLGANIRTSWARPSTASLFFVRSGRLRMRIGRDGDWQETRGALVAPNVTQQVETSDGDIVILKLDPQTHAYGRVAARLRDRALYDLPEDVAGQLSTEAETLLSDPEMAPTRVWDLALDLVGDPPGVGTRFDPRVERVLEELRRTFKTATSAARLAEGVGLSEGRLIHLFTKQVGVPLRRFVLWLRLRQAVYVYVSTRSLTEAAHGAGFADSAHLSRTFRSLYGIRPSALLRDQDDVRLVISCHPTH